MQDRDGWTALHFACDNWYGDLASSKVHLLLEAGANPTLVKNNGQTPSALLREHHPSHHTTIALLEQALDAEKIAPLVKARRLTIAARSNIVAPSCLQARVARGQPLPHVVLQPMTGGQTDGEDEEEDRKFLTMLAFLLGTGGGPEGEGMPRDVFRVMLDLLMPSWDPLRRGVVRDGRQLQVG